MSMESGGRSDKRGNEYENRYLVNLLLRLVDEKLSSIIIEPVGENSAEFIAETTDGKKIYYQCKASNGQADHWRVSDLKKHDVWKRAKEIILSDEENYYYFVSPVPYGDIDEICYRARTNNAPSEFFKKQIQDKYHGDLVRKIASEFELDIEKEKDKNTLVYILSHCFFELAPYTRDTVLNLESQVGVHFAGDQKAARILLEQFANSSEAYGVKFIPVDVVNYMKKKQFELRSYRFDDRILPQVEKLNEIYWGTFPAINGTLIHREATEQVLEKDDTLLNRLIGRFCKDGNRNVLIAVSRVVENCKTNWNPNVIDDICEIALHYAPESKADFTVTDSSDPSHLLARSLLENAINTTRGCAVKALSSQLWEKPALSEKMKPVITALCSDKNEIVRFAAFDCLLPFYNIDPSFSIEQMHILLRQDGRVCCAPGFWELMIRDYKNNPQFYQEQLIKASSSGVEDLSETAARMLASLVIQGQKETELSILEKIDYSEEQANSIARQAVAFYDNEEYHEKSEEVLKLLISKTNCELRALLSLFYHKKIIADRDEEFLKYVISSEQNRYILPEMLDYFNEYDGDLTAFCEVFADIAINLDDEYAVWRQQSVAENLIGCTLKLLDQGGADDHVREVCLTLWDALYKSNLQSMQALSKTIEELSIE